MSVLDKYELNLKTEQLIKLHREKDYNTAAEIADSFEIKKLKDLRLINIIADVYEKTSQYEKAKDILSLAYERLPMGRQLAYRLTTLSLKTGTIEDAQEYYDDFVQLSPKDAGKYVLQYEIARAKGEPLEKQAAILEKFVSVELDERWQYELAMLYNEMGQTEKCIELCDEIILWFNEGTYVDKAMELKRLHVPLTRSQQERYEKKHQAAEEPEELLEESPEPGETQRVLEVEEEIEIMEVEVQPTVGGLMEAFDEKQKKILEEARSEIEKTLQEVIAADLEEEMQEEDEPEPEAEPETETEPEVETKPEMEAETETEAEEIIWEEQEIGLTPESEAELEEICLGLDDAYREIFEKYLCIDGLEKQLCLALHNLVEKYDRDGTSEKNNLIVMGDAKTGKTSFAIKLIKEVNRERDRRGRKIVKVKGSNLNGKDIANTLSKLIGTDLIIERAASMSTSTARELVKAMKGYTGDMIIVFEDNNTAIDRLLGVTPDLKEMFPNVINIQGPGIKEWVEFASQYAKESGYDIDEMGRLALHVRIGNLCSTRENIIAEDTWEIVDEAIKRSKSGKLLGLFRKKGSQRKVLRETDFM
ncbi:tetratricopeptide repeat protein [Parasporobacterium paucivorans]|uniref:Uncharacterized protein n=1 Tax=Parasporobacterium paucivorans DSM 15970 TaxID=1122934 RepID=A0A1M6BCV5_9FIRM|nr:hypothetical protein [Parasporobacterium paucivorans]SHI46574.1 hypothetical protein SAMN02745691_00325 [Parasporobacterium paucivorans DSM 15970]